jgi:DNA-binding cell septation regulator SpoVG
VNTSQFIVLGIKPLENAGALRAYATIKVGGLVIDDVRIIQQEGQKAFVCAPQVSWTAPDGTRKFKAIVTFPDKWKDPLRETIISAWNDFLETGILPGGKVIGERTQ